MKINTLFQSLRSGDLTPNEFAVAVAVQALANGQRTVSTSTPQISSLLNGLSRHAVARALRNLEKKSIINWQTTRVDGGCSTIMVR